MLQYALLGAPALGLVGLLVVWGIYVYISKQDAGNDKMKDIALQIRDGAMAYMRRQTMYVGVFMICVTILLALFLKPYNVQTAVAYFCGALTSMLCGFIGMAAATKANVRTANAANKHGAAGMAKRSPWHSAAVRLWDSRLPVSGWSGLAHCTG